MEKKPVRQSESDGGGFPDAGKLENPALFQSPWMIVPILFVAAVLLSIGVTNDYRLKHEDNNALHATFALNHIGAGLQATRGQDAYVNPRNGKINFYAHHPPGCGLILAGVFSATGSDRPVVVRAVAIVATLLTLFLLWRLMRREEGAIAALVAASVFAIVPQAAFYGRMVNHEVLALPAIVFLVDRYFAFARGGGFRAATGLVVAATVGALLAWVTFFALAACAGHAVLSLRRPQIYPAAGRAMALLTTLGVVLFSADIAHIAWVRGGDLGDLNSIFTRRLGAGQSYGALEWLHKMLGFSRRLATASGTIAVVWLLVRAIRGAVGKMTLKPVEEMAAVFLATGLGYMVVFNWGAWQHHYWQFPLLPAVVIALALAVTTISGRAIEGRRRVAYRVLLGILVLEVVTASAVALYSRHTTPEDRVIETVEALGKRHL